MRKYVFLCLTVIAFIDQLCADTLSLSVKAESAILINADTGAILYEKNAHVLQYPASTTKIATAMYALKIGGDKLDTVMAADQDSIASITEEKRKRSNYTVPSYWLVPGASHMGIKKGEKLTLKDLIYGLMVVSADDAANVMAQHLSGTVPNFMDGMNAYLKEIGCKNTTFYNPHGLFHPKHQTTAFDLAIMMREAIKNPTFCEIIATQRYMRPKTEKQEATVLVQTNKLMRKGKFYYAKCIGGKTGYISAAQHTLVVAARHDNRTLIAVLLKSKDREDIFIDAIKMFDAAFNQPKVQRTLFQTGHQEFTLNIPGGSKTVTTSIAEAVTLDYYPAEEPQLKCMLYWKTLKLPVKAGDAVGELRLQSSDGKTVRTIPLLAEEDVSATWLWTLKHPFG